MRVELPEPLGNADAQLVRSAMTLNAQRLGWQGTHVAPHGLPVLGHDFPALQLGWLNACFLTAVEFFQRPALPGVGDGLGITVAQADALDLPAALLGGGARHLGRGLLANVNGLRRAGGLDGGAQHSQQLGRNSRRAGTRRLDPGRFRRGGSRVVIGCHAASAQEWRQQGGKEQGGCFHGDPSKGGGNQKYCTRRCASACFGKWG